MIVLARNRQSAQTACRMSCDQPNRRGPSDCTDGPRRVLPVQTWLRAGGRWGRSVGPP